MWAVSGTEATGTTEIPRRARGNEQRHCSRPRALNSSIIINYEVVGARTRALHDLVGSHQLSSRTLNLISINIEADPEFAASEFLWRGVMSAHHPSHSSRFITIIIH